MLTVEEAIVARDEFLKDNPHMQLFQEEIDTLLSKVPEDKRIEVIAFLIEDRLMRMLENLIRLGSVLGRSLKNERED